MNTRKDIVFGVAYFWAATFLTGIFIAQKFWLYNSEDAMVLSGSIASAKWLIQIVGALILLEDKKWQFIRRIGYVCFVGSVLLFVYYVFNFLPLSLDGFSQFVLSIGLSVLIMIIMYYKAVQKTGLSVKWFLLWLACLAVAVLLQMAVVF